MRASAGGPSRDRDPGLPVYPEAGQPEMVYAAIVEERSKRSPSTVIAPQQDDSACATAGKKVSVATKIRRFRMPCLGRKNASSND
jgi:hypothetical protein